MINTKSYIEYDYETFENFAELKKTFPKLASDMEDSFDDLDELGDSFSVFPTPTDYALYQLQYGWYSEMGFGYTNFNGAPNPIDWMDLDSFGKRLAETGDPTAVWISSNRKMIVEFDD